MKRGWMVTFTVICVLFAFTQLQAQWMVYDASVLPSETDTGDHAGLCRQYRRPRVD